MVLSAKPTELLGIHLSNSLTLFNFLSISYRVVVLEQQATAESLPELSKGKDLVLTVNDKRVKIAKLAANTCRESLSFHLLTGGV